MVIHFLPIIGRELLSCNNDARRTVIVISVSLKRRSEGAEKAVTPYPVSIGTNETSLTTNQVNRIQMDPLEL